MSLPGDIGAKTVTTFRHEVTYNKYGVSDLKSWLQKAIRRGNEKEAIWAAVEIYTMPKQSIVTNLFNRLRVISIEDVGSANPLAVSITDKVLESLQTKGKPTLPVKYSDVVKIAKLVSYLARSKHIRLSSDYKAVFITPKLRKQLIQLYPNVYKNHKPVIDDAEKATDAKYLGKKMVELLKKKDDRAFYYMEKLLRLETLPFKTERSTKSSYYILSLIGEMEEKLNMEFSIHTTILSKWLRGGIINSKIDNNLPMYYAAVAMLKRDELEDPKIKMVDVKIHNFEKNRKVPKVPEYALDKHTFTGRIAGKTALDFAKEGAVVENEDENLLNKNYREIYLISKTLKPEKVLEPKKVEPKKVVKKISTKVQKIEKKPTKPKKIAKPKIQTESDYVEFVVRIQATTSNAKTDTYFGIEKKTNRRVFVKGPYKNEELVDIPLKVFEMKQVIDPDLPKIKLQKMRLAPDLFPHVPLGFRSTIKDRTTPYWFLVGDNLVADPIPVKKHSTKAWGEIEVVDWDSVEEPKIPKVLKLKGVALKNYVINILMRYLLQIPDLADRNFMLMNDESIISVDEEGFNKDINFYTNLKKNKFGMIKKYVEKNWKEIKPILEMWNRNIKKSELKKLKWLVDRSNLMLDIKNVFN